MIGNWLFQILVALDRLFSALTGGWADETLSSRAWRLREHSCLWAFTCGAIDGMFFWTPDHCLWAYLLEQEWREFPPELRKL